MPELLTDQAAGLRRLLGQPRPRALAVTSANAGGGCSTVCANLCALLAQRGRQVVLFDAGHGDPGPGWMLGAEPSADLLDVVRGLYPLDAALRTVQGSIRVLRAQRALRALARLTSGEAGRVARLLDGLRTQAEFLVADAPPEQLAAVAAADDVLIVTAPDAAGVMATYRWLKRMASHFGQRRVAVLVNRASSAAQAAAIFGNLYRTATQFLHLPLEYMGHMPHDDRLERAALLRQPVVELFPSAPSARALRACADALQRWPEPQHDALSAFAGRLVAAARAAVHDT
jgi:flagellar biosynthesis protein FlhG